MRFMHSRKFKNTATGLMLGLALGSLTGCPGSGGTFSSTATTPPPASGRLSGTMLTSTPDSGLTVTVGMPEGKIANPAGNPVTITTVPTTDSESSGGYTRVAQDSTALAYSGNWAVEDMPTSQDPAMESLDTGAQVSYTFSGTAVRWIGYRDPASGIADVYLDGMRVATVDTYSTVPMTEVVLYSAANLPDAKHTLMVQVAGRHDATSLGSSIWVGGFDAQLSTSAGTSAAPLITYASTNGYTRIEQTDPSVSYSGPWTTDSSTLLVSYSGGSIAESSTAGATATLSFDGTAVRWIGYGDTLSGIADIILDGAHVATVDTYSTLPASEEVLYAATGLAAGNHTLTISVTGTHSLLSLGSAVWVDAFDVMESSPVITPPTVAMTAPTNGATVSGTATVSASATAASGAKISSVQFKLDGGALGSPLTSAPYSISWDSTSVANGPHILTAIATDSAGNQSTASPVTVTVSNSGGGSSPPTATMTAPANGSTVSGTVTVSAKASASSGASITSVQFELDGSALDNPVTSAPYSVAWNTTSASNGSHTLTAVATDSNGNTGTASAVSVTVSNSSGGASPPTVSMTAPSNGSTVSGSVAVSASAAAASGATITSVQFELDGSSLGSPVTSTPYSVSWDTTSAPNGSHTLTAVATDSNGNTGTASSITVTVSNSSTPPTVSMTAPANGSTVSGTVTVSASASAASGETITGVQFKLDGANLGGSITSASYSISWDSTAAANGSHSLTAVATDNAGKTTTASAVTVTVSNSGSGGGSTPPTVAMTAPSNGSSVSGTVTVSASASAESGASIASVQFELDGAALGSPVASAPYSVSWDSTSATNGGHTLSAVATDSNGNTGTASPIAVTVSNTGGGGSTPPTVAMTAPANGSTVSGSVTISASATAASGASIANVQFELDGAALDSPVTNPPYSISWDSTTAANGSHTLTAVATDSTGKQSTASSVAVTVSNGGGSGTTTRIEQDNPAVTYTGTWITASDPSVSGGTATETNQAGATATLTFTGTAVTWISYLGPGTSGISSVSVDGGPATQVDTYAASNQAQAKVFTASNLSGGKHTLTITVSGNYDRAGNSAYVVVDAFDVTD